MKNNIIVICRRVFYTENKFFPKENVYSLNDMSVAGITKWYKENIIYYEKRDSLERKSIPLISEELFKMFLIARLTAVYNDDNASKIIIEINNECVYISGPKVNINYPSVFDSKIYKEIWEYNNFEDLNFIELYQSEKSSRRVSIIYNSVYLNFKTKARNKKYFKKDDYIYSEKELIIKNALKLFSTSYEISKYTNLPQRTVRYYLNKMAHLGLIKSEGKLNSPTRSYIFNDDSTN
ncbi:MAG: hypothetical protein PHY08_11185 [Candidatus Cloacimonetes bacterium]|nr:hypothetical protein [Candidatus Cloacimonadota bacterium]